MSERREQLLQTLAHPTALARPRRWALGQHRRVQFLMGCAMQQGSAMPVARIYISAQGR